MPIPAGVVAPLILAVVLVTSAVAKARQPSSTVSAITLLRLPRFLQNLTIARALPVGEVVLALAMLSPWVPSHGSPAGPPSRSSRHTCSSSRAP